MRDWTKLRERYLQDGLPIRLGNLASNLGRIKTYCSYDEREIVESLIEESKYFIEWIATEIAETDVEAAAELVDLQVQLARWQITWTAIWLDSVKRAEVATKAKAWSDRVLEMSGLLTQ